MTTDVMAEALECEAALAAGFRFSSERNDDVRGVDRCGQSVCGVGRACTECDARARASLRGVVIRGGELHHLVAQLLVRHELAEQLP